MALQEVFFAGGGDVSSYPYSPITWQTTQYGSYSMDVNITTGDIDVSQYAVAGGLSTGQICSFGSGATQMTVSMSIVSCTNGVTTVRCTVSFANQAQLKINGTIGFKGVLYKVSQ